MQWLDDLLTRTSRTFALAIPLLPPPTREAVGLSYLLFRIADTFEDASLWDPAEKVTALEDFALLLSTFDEQKAQSLSERWLARPPTTHDGYLALLRATPDVVCAVRDLEADRRAIVCSHVVRTVQGMREVVAESDDGYVRLRSLEELRHYCYIVAGIVGELLTAIFVHDEPHLATVRGDLVRHERLFGEALQLVNILKDETEDRQEKRSFLPCNVERHTVLAIARADLTAADAYNEALKKGGACGGFRAFTGLPATLARANLDCLEQHGAGAKVPKRSVLEAFALFQRIAEDAHSASAHIGK